MKLIVSYICILLSVCHDSVIEESNPDYCFIIQEILNQKDINSILGLDKQVNVNPAIRIFDLSKRLNNCNGFYKQKLSNIPVSYFVEANLKPTLNTGYYRDLVINEFEDHGQNGRIVISISEFEPRGRIKVSFRIVLKYIIQKENNIQLTVLKLTDYVDYPPNYIYEEK